LILYYTILHSISVEIINYVLIIVNNFNLSGKYK